MHKLTDVSNRSARDKSPIIQVNLTKQKENHPQKKTVLNLTKIMKTKTEIGNLWEPQDNTQKLTSRTQSYRGSRNGSMYTENLSNLSNSPSPSKYDPDLHCSVHHNRQNLKKRRIRYVCCCKGCNQHLLCNECVIKKQNCKHQLLKLENLMQQPILIFLDNDEVVQQLILQSNQLYQKVKQQAEQQIELLSQNMSEFRQRINQKINQIEKQFKDRIDTQLQLIRVSVDHLQEICTVYKDDFEQRFDSGNSIISYKCNSDDPSNCIKQIVTELQKNLSMMPTLHDTNTQNIIDLEKLTETAYVFAISFVCAALVRRLSKTKYLFEIPVALSIAALNIGLKNGNELRKYERAQLNRLYQQEMLNGYVDKIKYYKENAGLLTNSQFWH